MRLLALLSVWFALPGCSPVVTHELPDGREVTCVGAAFYGGGVDCDWENAR